MTKPIAVLISDVHFKLDTLDVATAAFKAAIDKAAKLRVPLLDCGDITNDKALLRAEVVNRLLELQAYSRNALVETMYLVGNHSLVNEKSTASHSIEFLNRTDCWGEVLKEAGTFLFNFIPYQPTSKLFLEAIRKFPKGSIVIAHQGITTGNKGDYIQDHSAVNYEDVKYWKVFSGHYHQHQVIGNWVCIGNPYTLTFSEANDGPKGFLVLYDDGSFERVILPYRKHVIVEMTVQEVNDYQKSCQMEHPLYYVAWEDKLWIKVTGTQSELATLTKAQVHDKLGFLKDFTFKLDKIPNKGETLKPTTKPLTSEETFDKVIDASGETAEQKLKLKALWRTLCA